MNLKLMLLPLALLLPVQGPAPLDGIPNVVAKGEVVRLVKEGFVFTEGPVGMADGGLFFSDLQTADRINRLETAGVITARWQHKDTASARRGTTAVLLPSTTWS